MATNAARYKDQGFQLNVCCPGLNATGLSEGQGTHPSVGALNACRLTFTNKDGTLPW